MIQLRGKKSAATRVSVGNREQTVLEIPAGSLNPVVEHRRLSVVSRIALDAPPCRKIKDHRFHVDELHDRATLGCQLSSELHCLSLVCLLYRPSPDKLTRGSINLAGSRKVLDNSARQEAAECARVPVFPSDWAGRNKPVFGAIAGHNGPDKLPTIAEARACPWGVLASSGETEVTEGTYRDDRQSEGERERE